MSSIKQRPDGRWRARYRDEVGKEHAKHFPRRVDAQRWLDEVTASIVTGTYVDPRAGKLTFRDYATDWAARQLWVAGTLANHSLAVESATFAAMPINRVRTSHVEQWVKALDRDFAASTVGTRFRHARQVFRAAVKDRIITDDPTRGVALPKKRRAQHAMTVPTTAEVGSLLEAADPWFRPFIALCAFAGLRRGEACAVQVDDINFLGRTLHVVRQIQRAPGGHVIRAPKFGSERIVYLPDELVMMLSEHVRGGIPSGGWLFFSGNGALSESTADSRFAATRKRAGDADHVHLHSLRHFYASGLIAAGCDVVTVQRALGHSQASTTLNVYSHLWPTAEDRTRNAAAQLLSMVTGADQVRTEGVI